MSDLSSPEIHALPMNEISCSDSRKGVTVPKPIYHWSVWRHFRFIILYVIFSVFLSLSSRSTVFTYFHYLPIRGTCFGCSAPDPPPPTGG